MVEHHHARPQEATGGGGRNQPIRQCRGQVVEQNPKHFGSNRENEENIRHGLSLRPFSCR